MQPTKSKLQPTTSTHISSCTSCAASSEKTNAAPNAVVSGIALVVASTLVLFYGVLIGAPPLEDVASCHDTSSSIEVTQVIVAFGLGWLVCHIVKRRRASPQQAGGMVGIGKTRKSWASCLSNSTMCLLTSRVRSCRRAAKAAIFWLGAAIKRLKRDALIILAGAACLYCIISLFVSAFRAEPEADEPANDGIAGESSKGMRWFTAAWIFALSFKLRRELAEKLGYSCLLQPF